jgi:hypothetical protein
MGFCGAVSGTAGGYVHIRGSQRHCETSTAEQRECDSNDADLLFCGSCFSANARMNATAGECRCITNARRQEIRIKLKFRNLNSDLSGYKTIMRGLDPRIHQEKPSVVKVVDCRVKPGNDGGESQR